MRGPSCPAAAAAAASPDSTCCYGHDGMERGGKRTKDFDVTRVLS